MEADRTETNQQPASAGHTLATPLGYALGAFIGLWLPDIDLVLLPLLHHRSIITHSILIPWLLVRYARDRVPLEVIAGIYCGVAIHLAADVLSPAVGFGMVWLPWPIKVSIGPLSPLWVAGMAFLSLRFALSLCGIAVGKLIVIAVMFALTYSALHERAIVSLIVFGVVLGGVMWGRRQMWADT